jgi:hypothetical protein
MGKAEEMETNRTLLLCALYKTAGGKARVPCDYVSIAKKLELDDTTLESVLHYWDRRGFIIRTLDCVWLTIQGTDYAETVCKEP